MERGNRQGNGGHYEYKNLTCPKNVNYKQHLHNFKYNSDKMKLTERNQHAKCAVFIWGLDKLGV